MEFATIQKKLLSKEVAPVYYFHGAESYFIDELTKLVENNVLNPGEETFNKMKETYVQFVEDVLGLIEEKPGDLRNFLQPLLEIYKDAKLNRQYDKVDKIRASLKESGIVLKDMKTGVDWAYEE